jgi:hypothetical protein
VLVLRPTSAVGPQRNSDENRLRVVRGSAIQGKFKFSINSKAPYWSRDVDSNFMSEACNAKRFESNKLTFSNLAKFLSRLIIPSSAGMLGNEKCD